MRKRYRGLAALGCAAIAFVAFGNFAFFFDKTPTKGTDGEKSNGGAIEAPSGRKAFLVGADDYMDAVDLAYVKNDAEALAARLIEIGFKEEDVTILKTGGSSEDLPIKANVETRFAAFLETLAPGDFVVVYLSGHGIQPSDSKEAFFAPIDVKPSDPFRTSVSIDKMTTALDESAAKFRWFIVDACRNDPTHAKAIFKTRTAGAKGLVDPLKAPDSLWVLQSCAPGKVSYEGGSGVENSVFTLSLLEALDRNDSKANANADGLLTITEILSYVTNRTKELAFEHHGASQAPRWSCAEMTDFAVLDDLLLEGGLTPEEWREADALFREAVDLRKKREYRKAAEKLAQARKINAVNEEYKEEEALIAELLRLQSKAQGTPAASPESKPKAEETRPPAQNTGRTSTPGTKTTSQTQTTTQNDGSSSKRTSTGTSASGAWSGEYAAGTAKSLTIKGEEYKFRYCPAGTFTMGSPESESDRDDDETQCRVTLTNGFWMLETEVTQAMWKSAMGSNPSWFSSTGKGSSAVSGMNTSNFPVEHVSWEDCQEFVEKLNSLGVAPKGFKFRLPTEAEWEYACRAGTTTAYFWGSSLNGDKANCNGDFPYGTSTKGKFLNRTTEVGSYAANPWGVYDMHGNVWEWCEDRYGAYDALKRPLNPINVTGGSFQVLHGGSWNRSAKYCRSANRDADGPANRYDYYGFRLVLGREL